MSEPQSDKLTKLFTMLDASPSDTFLLYAIAMEYKKLGESSKAIEYLDKTVEVDAGYCYAYYQRGQVLEETGDVAGAKAAYNEGMAAANRVGDSHALSELQTALAMLE